MQKYMRGVLKLGGVLALAAFLTPIAVSLADGLPGRDFSRCVQACNDARGACGDRCQTDCRDLFPNGGAPRTACISSCKAQCDVVADECKLVCQALHHGDTCPTEP